MYLIQSNITLLFYNGFSKLFFKFVSEIVIVVFEIKY